jgi:methylated-DNA-[protein]-cysteine S-methyltransferase
MRFSQKVWDLCRQVPRGRVTTYKAIAEKLGTRAYRAVGNALNKNPCWPQVPCHRVVGNDGRLKGFALGIDKKAKLLKAEGITFNGGRVDLSRHLFTYTKKLL